MRRTLRGKSNKDYWSERWSEVKIDSPMSNKKEYPLKYALETVSTLNSNILEIGCGAGRILKYFHRLHYNIVGIDFIQEIIIHLKNDDPSLNVEYGDVTNLKFVNNCFDYILAFGVLHNLELTNVQRAFKEIHRVVKPSGTICISFRADNIHNRVIDYFKLFKTNHNGEEHLYFHKLNLTKNELLGLLIPHNFHVIKIYPVVNMPIWYHFKSFRSKEQYKFNESTGRQDGYKLNFLGRFLQQFLMRLFPNHWCNVYVIIARK